MRSTAAAIAVACLWFAACTREPDGAAHVGRPDGPYRVTLTTEPAAPRAGGKTGLVYRIEEARTAQPVTDLQIVHERILHTFLVGPDLDDFAHTHHEDFAPLHADDLAAARFRYPHVFRRDGIYRVVTEFTHRDRTWLKHFDVAVGDAAEKGPTTVLEPRRQFSAGGFRFALAVTPERPIAGKETEMLCRIETEDGKPVTDLAMVLGSEVHMATWRADGEHFGHAHAWTAEMAAMMAAMADHAGHEGMPAMMMTSGKQTYFGPEVPVRHVFPAPGVYKVFLDLAPSGRRMVAEFILEVGS